MDDRPLPPIEAYEDPWAAQKQALQEIIDRPPAHECSRTKTSPANQQAQAKALGGSLAAFAAELKQIDQAPNVVAEARNLEWYLKMMNPQQTEAFDDMCMGKNVFLTGEGGTGKSFVSEAFILWCIRNKKKIIICAPTGVAALNVGGVTMHRAFSLPIDFIENSYESHTNEKVRDLIQCADIVLIDEIGMVRGDNLCHIEYKCRKYRPPTDPIESYWGDKQVIGVGDFFQFAPIVDGKGKREKDEFTRKINQLYGGVYAFECNAWSAAAFTYHVLAVSERHRHSDNAAELMTNMNKARVGDYDCLAYFNEHCTDKLTPDQDDTVISFTNAAASAVNRLRLDMIQGQEWQIEEIIKDTVNNGDKTAPPTLQVRVGAKVTMLVNNPEKGYVNGTMGIVEEVVMAAMPDKHDTIWVRSLCGKRLYEVTRFTWEIEELQEINGAPQKVKIGEVSQFPLRLAWAITANKSQGKTLDSAIILLDGNWRTHGGLYVALSRVKTLEGITLKKALTERDLVCDFKVLHFYASITQTKMSVTYSPRLHALIAGLIELDEMSAPDGCLNQINDTITWAHGIMKERSMK